MISPLPHPTELHAAPGQSDAIDACGHIRHQDETEGGAPVVYVPWQTWRLAPAVIWELIIRPTRYQTWRVWIIGDPEPLFYFCNQRGWLYAAHRCDRLDPELPAVEDVGP